MADLAGLKEKLIKKCCELVENKLLAIDDELQLLQQSANEETKSSAGDKYETGRAMLALEKEKLLGQKDQLLQQLKPLKSIDLKKISKRVEHGAIVLASENNYFISAGLGAVKVDDDTFLVVSALAPIAQAMLEKEKGDFFVFGGKKQAIEDLL